MLGGPGGGGSPDGEERWELQEPAGNCGKQGRFLQFSAVCAFFQLRPSTSARGPAKGSEQQSVVWASSRQGCGMSAVGGDPRPDQTDPISDPIFDLSRT
eukprot:2291058-Alexandrium_andersonii.AAC.1